MMKRFYLYLAACTVSLSLAQPAAAESSAAEDIPAESAAGEASFAEPEAGEEAFGQESFAPEDPGISPAPSAGQESPKGAKKAAVGDSDGLIEDAGASRADWDKDFDLEITDAWYQEELRREEEEAARNAGPVYGRLYPPAPLLEGINAFRQGDMRWGTHSYGYANAAGTIPATISSSGCGLLSLVNAVYYMTGSFLDPGKLADWATAHGYRQNGVGTVHSLYQAYADAYGSTYGFAFAGNASSLSQIRSFLHNGGTAIISTDHHLMCVVDYDEAKGGYLLLDSAPSPYRGTYPVGYRYLSDQDFAQSIPVYAIMMLRAVPAKKKEMPVPAFPLNAPAQKSGAEEMFNYIARCYREEYLIGLHLPVPMA